MLIDSKAFLKNLRRGPGVYVMRDSDAKPLYVGKARNLKNRLKSYFYRTNQSGRTGLMVAKIADVEIHVTTTETEALLLESNLIKSLKPRYNVLLRDDKSYPYLRLSVEDQYPGLAVHRGTTSGPGQFFGPYANVGAIRLMLNQLQKIIPIRQCDNNYFRNR
ncbi:MAG TPA: GIY-YIG nuclease family protein, partial [Arenicellales bacterium]|nr:GIY-YIG nuclease family protein [Arenicellales bacterium]